MSNEQGNASSAYAEEEGEEGTPKGLSSNSLSMLQRPHAISGNSNAEFLGAQRRQHPVPSLPSTPPPGTPQSVVPATMDLLPLHHHGLELNPVAHNQLNIIPQQNVVHNEQFHLPPHMSRVNAGVSQIPSDHQMVQNIRNPYPTVVSNFSHPPSKLPAEYGFETPSRSLVPIGNMPPAFVEQLVHMQRGYQQMANNPSFTPFGPQQDPSQAAGYPAGGAPYHHFLLPTMPNPQMKMVPKDQPFNWLPQGLGNQNQESNHPSTSNSRCMNSLYDPAFEEMGLPIDPHLRMFLASMNQDKAPSNETNRSK